MTFSVESVFTCGPEGRLVGIVSRAAQEAPGHDRPGIVFLNAGNAHRVGPNRVYILLSRLFAARGFTCCRFDLSGIGDSPGRSDGIPFREYALHETRQVLDDLSLRIGPSRFVLIGLCAGADIAFDTASEDQRVAGMILINGAFVDGDSFAEVYHRAERRTQRRYYAKRLLSPRAWLRLLSARSAFWSILVGAARKRLAAKPAAASRRKSATRGSRLKWAALAQRRVPTLLIFAEGSIFRDVFRMEVEKVLIDEYPAHSYRVVFQKAADHTFTLLSSQEALAGTITSWLDAEFGRAPHVH
jgi:pimeloyl-ACP methyl ester carboxylesterase